MAVMSDVLKAMDKEYGKGIITAGVKEVEAARICTGVFPFDLATGGGFPEGKISIVWGKESSLKTTLCLLAIACYQQRHPDRSCVLVDVENSYDPEWGRKLGVDNDRLYHVLPEYAEQAVDIIEGLLYADDAGLIVTDSLAALITANEVKSSADKAVVGGTGLVIGKLYRKVTLALSAIRKDLADDSSDREHQPTFVAINQIRQKIGVMFGCPDTMPGGNAFKFASSMTIKVYGKDEFDKKIDPTLAVWKICNGTIEKYKVPIVSRTFEFKMSIHKGTGLKVGRVNDWAFISRYLKDLDYLTKGKKNKGWDCFDEHYKVLTDIQKRIRKDPEFADLVRNTILANLQPEDEDDYEDAELGDCLEEDAL